MRFMLKFIYESWNIVMNSDRNPLSNIQDLHVRHLIMQLLAWMWCIVFSLWAGSLWIFGFLPPISIKHNLRHSKK